MEFELVNRFSDNLYIVTTNNCNIIATSFHNNLIVFSSQPDFQLTTKFVAPNRPGYNISALTTKKTQFLCCCTIVAFVCGGVSTWSFFFCFTIQTLSKLYKSVGCAIAQAVSRRLPTATTRVQTRVWSCEILWWTKVGLGQVFSDR
jgi:hypothetical protein